MALAGGTLNQHLQFPFNNSFTRKGLSIFAHNWEIYIKKKKSFDNHLNNN